MKKITYALWLLLLLPVLRVSGQSLVINEIITSNSEVNTDEDDSYQDWVELYNGSAASIDLEGYGLSDVADEPYQWVFPAKVLAPGEHLLVWCSDKNRTNPEAPLHTNFKISSGGETIVLTKPDGTVADSYAPVVIPENYSYGRQPNGSGTFVIFPEPTPGSINNTPGYSEILDAPVFSAASGFYTAAFSLTLSSETDDAVILYTLDGSEPDEDNLFGTTYQYKNNYPENPGDPVGAFLEKTFRTRTYTNAITINDRTPQPNKISAIATSYHNEPTYIPDFPVMKSTTVRAKVIKPGAMPSPVITRNYFVSSQGSEWFSLPVASINTNEDLLFDYEKGIHVAGEDFDDWREANPGEGNAWAFGNYDRSGDDWEIPANFSYFVDGEEVGNQNIGLRIHGGFTTRFQIKSLRLYARSEFGKSTFDYPFFGEGNDNSFKRLILRNSGNDYNTTYFLDAFIHQSTKHLNFSTMDYRPVITFVNGEYWGLLNMRERFDSKYFDRVYGIDEDDLEHIEISGTVQAKEGSLEHYEAMMDFLAGNSLANEANYAYITTQLDDKNFADYFITEVFINNLDWLNNNVELFRKNTDAYIPDAPYGHDGRWRWILKDTDVSFGLASPYTYNTLAHATATNGTGQNPPWATLIFRRMLENEGFRNYFISRFADLLNTTFLTSRMQGIHAGMKAQIAGEMPNHIARWDVIGSMAIWNDLCNAISNFAAGRPAVQRSHIREKFGIAANVNATLDVSDATHGFITINTIDIHPATPGVSGNPYPWSGIYFHGIPVTLKAVPVPGYAFSHWTGDVTGTDPEVEIVPEGNFSVIAHFKPAPVVAEPEPLYFWVFDGDVPNDTPLVAMDATFEAAGEAYIDYQSCLEGYPFTKGHPAWRTASMERRNSPTDINYLPEANNDVPFAESGMKGMQVTQPFADGDRENTMVFHVPATGYKDIKFAFAAKDEGAADAIIVDYYVNGAGGWSTAGLDDFSLELSDAYQRYEIDFSGIAAVNDNPGLSIRLRFTGDNMTASNGDRVTFNNISLTGTAIAAGTAGNALSPLTIYPNPVHDILNIANSPAGTMDYKIFSADGKLLSQGRAGNSAISMKGLQSGLYLVHLSFGDQHVVKRVIKK